MCRDKSAIPKLTLVISFMQSSFNKLLKIWTQKMARPCSFVIMNTSELFLPSNEEKKVFILHHTAHSYGVLSHLQHIL